MARTLITGVSGSLGIPLAVHFLAKGDEVTGLDLREPRLPEGADAAKFHFAACDLAAPEAIEATLADLLAGADPFDVVINNVGLIHSALLVRMAEGQVATHSFEDWKRVIDVTLGAAFCVTATCATALIRKRTPGVFVNISSIAARGNRGQAAYSAAKAGINGLTVSLAKELGPLGIRVAAVAPGFIDTASTRGAMSEGHLKRTIQNIPLGRLGKVSEVVDAVEFVVENEYFHGKVLELDGGLTL